MQFSMHMFATTQGANYHSNYPIGGAAHFDLLRIQRKARAYFNRYNAEFPIHQLVHHVSLCVSLEEEAAI